MMIPDKPTYEIMKLAITSVLFAAMLFLLGLKAEGSTGAATQHHSTAGHMVVP